MKWTVSAVSVSALALTAYALSIGVPTFRKEFATDERTEVVDLRQGEGERADTSTWKTYVDEEFNFSIQLPGNVALDSQKNVTDGPVHYFWVGDSVIEPFLSIETKTSGQALSSYAVSFAEDNDIDESSREVRLESGVEARHFTHLDIYLIADDRKIFIFQNGGRLSNYTDAVNTFSWLAVR